MWKRPSRSMVLVRLAMYLSRMAWSSWCGFLGAPGPQMAGSLASAVPGSSPLHVMPRRTTLNPRRAISEASAEEKFQGFFGSG